LRATVVVPLSGCRGLGKGRPRASRASAL